MGKAALKFLYGLIAIAIAFAVAEGISYLILKKINPNGANKLRFNRELSGYTVFKNTPNFIYGTYKSDAKQPDIKTDVHGLICDEPLSEKKDSNEVRIFLMGGSAMIGAGQTNGFDAIKQFPKGTYAYSISIAGYLKQYLQQKYPNKKITVVNAATYGRQLHQSLLFYLETISHLHPDIVIDMDGYNDVKSISTGYVYELTEFGRLKSYVDLKQHSEQTQSRLKSVQLANYILMKKKDANGTGRQDYGIDTSVYNQQAYLKIKPSLQQSAQPFLKVLKQYANVLNGDSVHFIFALQPILYRGINKQLADYELKMKNEVGREDPKGEFNSYEDPRISGDANLLKQDSIKAVGSLVQRYFFDDWLSSEIQQTVEHTSANFIDLNKEITPLDSSFHFYTDYCHMTKEGYKFIGERFGQVIVDLGIIR